MRYFASNSQKFSGEGAMTPPPTLPSPYSQFLDPPLKERGKRAPHRFTLLITPLESVIASSSKNYQN